MRLRRDAFAGVAIGAMLAGSIGHGLAPTCFPREASVIAAWLAGAAAWSRLPRRVRAQVGVMLAAGLGCLATVAAHRGGVEWGDAAGRSLPILALLAGVAFLRLVHRTGIAAAGAVAPRGFGAYLRTMVGVHLFGTVINLSSLVVFADRLARSGPLARREIAMLGRSYSMAGFYSPFIGGVALALSLVPGVRFPTLVLAGVTLTCIGFLVIALLARLEEGERLADFRGYPFRLESLWLPLALGGAVVAVHWTWPTISVLLVISLLAPAIAVAAVIGQAGGARASRITARFVLAELPGMGGEIALFLAAGVLGGGLAALVSAYPTMAPELSLTAATALAALAGIAILALGGVHPLVPITAFVAVVLPASPDPTLLAAVCVMGWGIGSAVSPYSGVNLVLAARGGVSSWTFPRWNALYCAVMVLAAGLVLAGLAGLTTHR